jgi:hypothetical protein
MWPDTIKLRSNFCAKLVFRYTWSEIRSIRIVRGYTARHLNYKPSSWRESYGVPQMGCDFRFRFRIGGCLV